MTIAEMLEQSAILTVLGMAIVFAFLWVMIVCINFTGKLINRGRDKEEPELKGARPRSDAAVTAAITSAVTEYRKKNP